MVRRGTVNSRPRRSPPSGAAMETELHHLGSLTLFGHGFFETAGRLLFAIMLGMVLGLDREARNKPAGMRSHMLVALTSACLTLMTFAIVDTAKGFGDAVRTDPLRLIQAVVTGIAFLGAGVIIQGRGSVTGITTGASLWVAGAIGIASGIGRYLLAGLTTLLAFIILFVLGRLEERLKKDKPPNR